MGDLLIINKIEEEISVKLPELSCHDYGEKCSGYNINKNDEVTGLCLTGLNLTEIPNNTLRLQNLLSLDVSANNIELIDDSILKLSKLNTLNISANNFTLFASIVFELKELSHLYLTDNNISKLPKKIQRARNLLVLDINKTKIHELPTSLCKNKNLRYIYLDPKKIKVPPEEIYHKGANAIKAYLASIEDTNKSRPINEVKVLLVGEGAAGKTSLLKLLRGKPFNPNESQTHGINIRDVKAISDLGEITIRFWDFGGQEIMHATHQFFLSKRSLYILVLDGRKDEKTEYWLKHIETFGGMSPVLIVINKIDENPSFDLNRRFLFEKYPNICGFLRISCKKNIGIDELQKKLIKEITKVDFIKTTWGISWFNIKEKLENITTDYISNDTYVDMCIEEGIREEDAHKTLLDFLNDLGVILHFPDLSLHDTNVINPRWVTEAIYSIINSKILATTKGVLKFSYLDTILSIDQYPRSKYLFIIELMKKFELCYRIDSCTVLVPELLDIEEPIYNYDKDNSISMFLKYNFMPRSIIPKFIVRMHDDIYQDTMWRTGVQLFDKNFKAIALIKEDAEEKIITISVTGEQKRDYLANIRKTFKGINDSFKNLKVSEMVPLPDNDKMAIEYEELIGHHLLGRSKMFIGKLRKTYNVDILLEGIEKKEKRIYDMGKIEFGNVSNSVISLGDDNNNVQLNINKEVDDSIASLINVLTRAELENKEYLIRQLKDVNIISDKKKLSATIGNVIANAGGISSVVSAATAVLSLLG